MNLDEEFEKMYGGSGAASAAPDLEAEFAKTYGGEQKPRAWEEGDGGSARLPEGETNEWGGNLRNEGRKVLIRRDKDGKVNGYSTTSSIPVKDADGKIAIVPTVVDGKELTPDEAVRHYEETGEHWGKADDEDSAREIARKVHERHEEYNRKGWNDYIHSHWDEMDDSIRNDRGTAYEHRKREDPDSITDMERLAHDDTSKERFHRQYKAGRKEGEDAAADMDDLAEIAKGAGLEDWQVDRIRRESKDAAEMRKNLAYVAGNRVGNGTEDDKKGGKLTDYIRSAAGAVSHAILDRIPDITKAAGTALGGKSDETQSFMADDQYARKEGEDVRQWARRKGIHLNRKNFDAWNEFFKWEAPIEGKEGLRPSKSLMAPGRGENRSTMERIGDELVKIGNQEQADIDRIIPRHLTGNPVMNFIEDTASGVGGFMFAGPLMVGTAYGSSYQGTRDYALQNGATPEQADALGKGAGVIDTALTAAFYRAPVRKWMKSKGIAPVMDPVKNHSFSEMSRAVGNFAMKKVALEQSAAALEAGAILGIQGAADEAIRLKAEGKDLDTLGSVGDIAISGIEGAVSGAGVGLVMGGAHLLGARANARRAYRDTLREVIRPEAGNAAKEEAAVLFRQRLAELNPEATADFCEAFERGSVATKKQVDAAGLPPMSVVERGQYWELLKAQGITSENIRKNAKLGTTAEGGAAPEAPVAPEVPPSDTLSGKIEEMGGEPVRFSIPQDENGKPRFTTMAWRDNRTGREGKNRIAIDERTQVAIMDNGDGTFTAYDNLQNAVDSDNLDDAIENANELALAQQYTNIERQKKLQVIENAHASKFGEKNVVAFPTMADAVNQIGNSIRQGNPVFGISSIEKFTDPRRGFREDSRGFHTPDGMTVLIVDNIDDPADVEKLLRHEIVGHGGPKSEFGDGVVDFLSSVDSKELSDRRQRLIDAGMSEAEADSTRGRKEIFANMLQEREHNPTVKQRLGSWLNDRARKIGAKKTYSDADIEVMASRWEKEARGTNGDLDLREPGDRFEFIELEDEAPRETHENAPVSAPKETPATSRPEAAKPVEKREPAKSEPSKPVSERNIVEKLTDKAEAQEIPLSEIEVSDSRIPQFKEGADPETGEVEPLTGEPYDLVSNPIVVMEFKDGKKVVVTGRHRYGLYKRSGRKTIAARVIRESDGWNVKDAMAIDAIGNIIDEKGTEKDYVKYFDEAKPSHEEARAAGFLDRPKGQRAFSIYEGATEDTKQLIDWEGAGGDGKISVDQAGIISSAAPKNANKRFGAVQRILTQKALGGLRGKKLGILARSLAEEAKNRKDTPSVSGEMQLDLFTSEEDQALLAMEDRRADYRVRKAGEYGRVAEVLRTAISKGGKLELNEEYAKELGITDPKDRQQLIAARDKAVERANYWENAIVLEPADKSAMDDEITAKDKAATEKREAIKAKAEEKLAAVKAKRAGKPVDENKKTSEKVVHPKTAENKAKTDVVDENAKAKTKVVHSEEPVKTPVKSQEEELTGQEKARSAANAAFSAITGIPVVQVGKNGKILSDSTPAAEKAISGKGAGKSAVKSAEPKTKMKDAASEAKAQKLEDDLGALFDSPQYDPNAIPVESHKYRQFDVRTPDGEKGTIHAYTKRQAETGAIRKFGLGSVVYEQGGLENAIIKARNARNRERAFTVHEKYPLGSRVLGPAFDRAVTEALDGGSASQVASLLVSAQHGGNLRPAVFAIGRRDRLTESGGASHYADGTVVVPLHDGKSKDPKAFNRSLLHVLGNAEAFGEMKDIEFLRGSGDRILGMMKGTPIVGRVYPKDAEIAQFLEGRGFRRVGVHPRIPGMIWTKGNVTFNQNHLSWGKSADGSLVPLFCDSIATHSEVGVDFDSTAFDPAMFQKRVGVLAELAKTYADNGVGTFETLADRMYAKFADKFDAMKPYLRGIWNAVAEQLDLPEVTREQANEIFDKITTPKEADNGSNRNIDDANGVVLDGTSSAEVAGTPQNGEVRGPSSGNSPVGSGTGARDGHERGPAEQPVVGHDELGATEHLSDADGEGRPGNGEEGQVPAQDGGSGGGQGAGEGEHGVRLDAGHADGVQPRVAEAAHKASPDKPRNYVITDEDEHWLNTSTPSEKIANNMAVIKLLNALAEDDRQPTPEERTMMARYVGFGGFPQAVDQKYKDAYEKYGDVASSELPKQTQASLKGLRFGLKGYDTYREMRQYLTPEEFQAIRQAMIDAFYTTIGACRAIHGAVKAAGFNGGRMLETSAGTGNFIGTGSYDSVPHWTAIELDKTTGKILQYLYPEANVKIQGYQDVIIPPNFIDAAISNVPFSNDIHPYDPEYNKYDFNLHDYFFAKTVDRLRPGGVAALITSTGTLDKTDKKLIRFMEEHGGKIVGALRLPNGYQSKNAGTEVNSDIIFIQKVQGKADNSEFAKNGEMLGIKVNGYFVNHPEMIFGTAEAGKSMYGNAPALKIKATRDPSELPDAVKEAAKGLSYLAPNEAPKESPLDIDADKTGLRRGNVGIVDGKIVKREGDVIQPVDLSKIRWPKKFSDKGHTLMSAVKQLVEMRGAYHEYIDAQKNGGEDAVMLKRAKLNAVYDSMLARYKCLHDPALSKVFDLDDADGIVLQNLEAFDMVPDGETKTGKPKFKMANFRKSDALKKRTLFGGTKAAKADNALDGLRISLNECGTVNLARIAELTGKTKEEVSKDLTESGHVFQNPATGGLETRDEYLSGSVRRKLREARAAADVDPSFKRNIEELEKVQPEDKPATKIRYQLGQKFIPNDMYREFLAERIFGCAPDKVTVGFDEKADSWRIEGFGSNQEFARRCPDNVTFTELLKRIFNGSSLAMKDRVDDGDGKYHYVLNPQKTQAAESLRDDITAELSKWMVATADRAKRIERSYNDIMNDDVERKYDTELLTLDGISDSWAKNVQTPGYEHQKRTISRGVFGGNLCISHCVGAGKSFEMFSICMQLRRLGLARKPMLTVPNHMVESGQVLREFLDAYPGANVLVATTKDLNSSNRRRFLAKAANGDWDCVVVPHSSFSLIGMDPKVQAEYIQQEIDDLREMMEAAAAEGKKKGNAEKRIEKKIASKQEKMKKLLDSAKKDSTVPFENIGVDYLLVDEAHNFKGLDITTKMSNVSGVTGSVSQRAQDMEMKCRYLAKLHGSDKGVIFASGTIISNSISEMYTTSRFLAPLKMREMGIYKFDDWAKTFGVVETKPMPRASGKGYQEKTRFASFQNLVELKRLFHSFADVVLDEDLSIPRPFMLGGKPIVHKIPADDIQTKYVDQLDKRLDSFKGKYDPKVDNPLKVVTEGRLVAIDPSLLGIRGSEHRRLNTAADEIYRIWQKSTAKTAKDGKTVLDGTQLVFCDSGVPKEKKFRKVVRTEDGGYATKGGFYWQFYVSPVDANGMRHARAVRSDGEKFSPAPFADHSMNGIEDVSSVYAAFEEMAQTADAYNKTHKLASKARIADPVGVEFDINRWLDENAEAVGYDIRFENPFTDERKNAPAEMEDDEDIPAEEEITDEDEEEDAPEKDQDEKNNGDVAVENMLRGKFNVYSHLKKLLIARGIPENEIVFIHDAEDAKAKRALFEKFNAVGTNFRGGPRILIGNTPKMGEGANVQKRLVAIHHLDVPWKPAWLIQRDGRGIRAGNLNGEIGIHRYVTEGTFDVYSYDKVSTKQQFINQAMNHDMTIDEVEDVDDAVLAAEEAKAAAAGPIGKYMLEKTRIEQNIRKAQLTLANQQSDIRNAQAGLDWDAQKLRIDIEKMEKDKELLENFKAAKGEQPFGIEVLDTDGPFAGQTITDNDQLAQFLMQKCNFFVKKGSSDGMIGKLYGMPVWWREVSDGGIESHGVIDINTINAHTPDIPIVNRVAVITKGTVSILKSAVTHATNESVLDLDRQRIAASQARFDASKASIERLKIDETLPEKIRDMTVRLAEVHGILGIKDEGVKNAALQVLNERIREDRDAQAAAIALAELNKPKPVDRQIAELEQEAAEAEFDSPEFNPDANPPAGDEDKRFGFTNDDVKFGLKVAGIEPPKHVTKADEVLMRQADALLSNREYMRKLAHAVYQKNRATRDYENVALGIYNEQCKDALNAAKSAYDEMAKALEDLPEDTDQETIDILKKNVKELKAELLAAQRDYRESAGAKIGGASEQGRALRSNRVLIDAGDYSYAGIRGQVESELGGKPVPEKMDEEIGRLAENFKDLDERSRGIAVERLKLFSQKVVEDLKRGNRLRSMGGKAAGNELKRVMRNYNDALNQVQVHADEAGGTLIGLADQLYPSWGKWIKAIGEYHCFVNPEITEQGVIDAIRADLNQYLEDGIDEATVRDVLTGFGQNFRQSRYDSQRKMNDLKAQSLAKRQRDYMIENGKLPPQTGMVRDEASDETRALRKEVQELKKDLDEQEGGPRALKGALASAKTRIRNTIADLERAIMSGERIERSKRTPIEDAELRMLKSRRDELRRTYEEMFGEKSVLTDEQRRQRAEKALAKVLERALERLGRAQSGDFSAAPRASRVDSPMIETLREEIANTNRAIRELKDAAYPDGTPEEIAKKNARRMEAREKAIQRMQERFITGDIRPNVKNAPPMPPEMQKRYNDMGKELKRAHEKLRQLRQEAKDSLKPTWLRKVGEAWRFMDGIQKMAMASLDFTQVGNQTGVILTSHPAVAARSFAQSLPSFVNESNAENIENELLSDPLVLEAVDKKWLHWKKAGDFAGNRGDRVEFFDAIDRGFKIGGRTLKLTDVPYYGTAIANSDRLYATYINTVAANLYSLICKDTGLFPKGASSFEKRVVADMVNVMTGSGTLSKQTRAVLGKAMWAPGLVDSQFKRSLGYTIWHPWTADSSEDGSGTFKERAKMSWVGTKEFVRSHLGAMLLGGTLLALFGSDDEKYRFWHGSLAQKLMMLMAPRIGHTSLDFTGGESAFYRLFNKLGTGVKESGSGRQTPIRDYFGEIAHFMQGRINPLIGNVLYAVAGSDYANADYGPLEVIASFAPISIKEAGKSIWLNSVEDGHVLAGIVCATLVMFGIGKGSYRKDDYKIQSNKFREAYKEMRDVIADQLLTDEDKRELVKNMEISNRLLKRENVGKVSQYIKQVDSLENQIERDEKKLSVKEAKDGHEDTSSRMRLEAAKRKLETEKQNVLNLIRSLR